ncbi:hypothetical protein BC940DRAFT_345114 [Gongronella butleri]|nr:hypothetical protein BC940DRAFT_345114 [Gongronella butleri]
MTATTTTTALPSSPFVESENKTLIKCDRGDVTTKVVSCEWPPSPLATLDDDDEQKSGCDGHAGAPAHGGSDIVLATHAHPPSHPHHPSPYAMPPSPPPPGPPTSTATTTASNASRHGGGGSSPPPPPPRIRLRPSLSAMPSCASSTCSSSSSSAASSMKGATTKAVHAPPGAPASSPLPPPWPPTRLVHTVSSSLVLEKKKASLGSRFRHAWKRKAGPDSGASNPVVAAETTSPTRRPPSFSSKTSSSSTMSSLSSSSPPHQQELASLGSSPPPSAASPCLNHSENARRRQPKPALAKSAVPPADPCSNSSNAPPCSPSPVFSPIPRYLTPSISKKRHSTASSTQQQQQPRQQQPRHPNSNVHATSVATVRASWQPKATQAVEIVEKEMPPQPQPSSSRFLTAFQKLRQQKPSPAPTMGNESIIPMRTTSLADRIKNKFPLSSPSTFRAPPGGTKPSTPSPAAISLANVTPGATPTTPTTPTTAQPARNWSQFPYSISTSIVPRHRRSCSPTATTPKTPTISMSTRPSSVAAASSQKQQNNTTNPSTTICPSPPPRRASRHLGYLAKSSNRAKCSPQVSPLTVDTKCHPQRMMSPPPSSTSSSRSGDQPPPYSALTEKQRPHSHYATSNHHGVCIDAHPLDTGALIISPSCSNSSTSSANTASTESPVTAASSATVQVAASSSTSSSSTSSITSSVSSSISASKVARPRKKIRKPTSTAAATATIGNASSSPVPLDKKDDAVTPILRASSPATAANSSKKKHVRFVSTTMVQDTFSKHDYDRASDPYAACARLTALLANQIKEELNAFKLHEMVVHHQSRANTHFFL